MTLPSSWASMLIGVQSGGGNTQWNDVIFANGVFVAVGSVTVAVSSDGRSWTMYAVTGSYQRIIWDGSRFVAIGGGYVGYSTSGTSWTEISITVASGSWDRIAYNGTNYVIGDTLNGSAAYSTNLSTWTLSLSFTGESFTTLVWGAGTFVMASQVSGTIWTSPTGTSWSTSTGPFATHETGTFGSTLFIISQRGGTGYAYSSNGSSWTTGTIPAIGYKALYLDGYYIFLGPSGSLGSSFYASSNATSWTTVTTPSTEEWLGLGYQPIGGVDTWVICGINTTTNDGRGAVSPPTAPAPNPIIMMPRF